MERTPRMIFALLAGCLAMLPVHAQDVKPASAGAGVVEVGASEVVMTMRVDGELVFDTEGRVIEHKVITPGIQQELLKLANDEMARMRFEPVRVDGRPANGRTFARMTLLGREREGGRFEVGIEQVLFFKGKFHGSGAPNLDAGDRRNDKAAGGWALASGATRLRYPIDMMRSGVSGAVTVRVLMHGNGSVEDAFVTQSAMFNVRGRERELDAGRKSLEQMVLSAVRTWRFKPPAKPGSPDDPEWRTATIPVFFQIDASGSERAGKWRMERRGPRRMATWEARSGQGLVGVSDMEGDEGMVSPDPDIKRVQ